MQLVPLFEENYCAYDRLGLVWILERFVNQVHQKHEFIEALQPPLHV